jgi:hypothetical protein
MDKLGLGRKFEQAVMRRWEWYGFKTWQPGRVKYCSQDIFELFDFVAVKPLCPVNLVQVKRRRRKEAEIAFVAIKSFAKAYPCPIAPFVVLWHKERATGAIAFEAWELGPLGWMNAGGWSVEA